MQRANAGFKRAAGSGEGLRRTALDVLQHQRQAPRLVLRQALGCRPALRLMGKPPAAVLFTHDLAFSEGFKKVRQGFGLSVAQLDCDGGQLALDFGS